MQGSKIRLAIIVLAYPKNKIIECSGVKLISQFTVILGGSFHLSQRFPMKKKKFFCMDQFNKIIAKKMFFKTYFATG